MAPSRGRPSEEASRPPLTIPLQQNLFTQVCRKDTMIVFSMTTMIAIVTPMTKINVSFRRV